MNLHTDPSPELSARIERLVGAEIEGYQPVSGGYTAALRFVCRTESRSVFVKVGVTESTARFLNREIESYKTIHGDFMPRLVACESSEVEPILVTEDLSGWHWPPPWHGRRIDLVLTQIDAMHQTKVSPPPFADFHNATGARWRAVADDPNPILSLGMVDSQWIDMALPLLLEYEERCPTVGDCLCHWDLRSDNMCLTEGRAVFVDWNLAAMSNPKLDLGFWLPSLAYEGGPQPETILPEAPEVAAWVSGFFAGRAGLPDIPDAPRVRLIQRQQLEMALPWAIRALDLSGHTGRPQRR